LKLKLKMTDGGEGWAPVDNSDQDPADDLGEPKEKMMKKELNEKLENGTTNGEKAGFSEQDGYLTRRADDVSEFVLLLSLKRLIKLKKMRKTIKKWRKKRTKKKKPINLRLPKTNRTMDRMKKSQNPNRKGKVLF